MGARAFIPLALAATILFSGHPVATAAADEPSPVVTPAPTPAVDPTPTPDPTATPTPTPDPTATPTPTPTASPTATPAPTAKPARRITEAQQIIAIAKKQLGDPWVYGAMGPKAFDCSGLVAYAFRKAGDLRALDHGRLRSAQALYRWFKARGLASGSNPHPGDLVIWGGGTHIGIYIGNGKAISTLTRGVTIHRVHAVTARFTAYLHTGMWKATN